MVEKMRDAEKEASIYSENLSLKKALIVLELMICRFNICGIINYPIDEEVVMRLEKDFPISQGS